jgi:epoxyqueuosine reductase
MNRNKKSKVLLHICCGVCALHCIDFLQDSGYAVTGFFYNPNIEPTAEYVKRREAAEKVSIIKKIPFIEGKRDLLLWKEVCDVYKNDTEGGKRCCLCYEFRLKKVWEFALSNNYDLFATTLTISPHKDASLIFAIGKRIGAKRFLPIDFKKNDGFTKTIKLVKEHNIYRQNYCGCIYSKR